ncbi:MAG: hypothetical protein GX771_00660 [Halomonadaceae bacterium]|nr:hypothetical protein [Halomonadaceae bacterium]
MAAASRQINAAFAGPAAAARAAGATAIGKQPVFGPYKMPILYDKGEVIHTVGQFIDKLRRVRPYTQNSTEFRCDPLGLAVYVAPHTFIKDGVPRTAIRVVAYDYNKTSPTPVLLDNARLIGTVEAML